MATVKPPTRKQQEDYTHFTAVAGEAQPFLKQHLINNPTITPERLAFAGYEHFEAERKFEDFLFWAHMAFVDRQYKKEQTT